MVNPSQISTLQIALVSQNHKLIEQLRGQYEHLEVHTTLSLDDTDAFDVILVDDDTITDTLIHTRIPHILLADVSQTEIAEYLSSGYTDYIPKPIELSLVEHRLKRILVTNQPTSISTADQADYQTILSSMSEPVFVFDKDGRYVRIPYNQTDNYVEPPEQMLGQTIHSHFPKELADRFLATIHKALDTKAKQVIDYELSIGDRRAYFSAVVSPVQHRDEVVWVARDVTHKKLSELALIETEKSYRQLFEHANDMIFTVDLKTGRILSANKQAQKQLGYTREELLQLKMNQIEVVDDDSQSRVVTRTLTTSGHIVVEQIYRTKDGTHLPVETSSRLTTQQNRQVLLSFSRNIKQRKVAMQAEAEQRYFAEVLRDSISQLARALTMNDVLDIMLSTVKKVVDSDSSNIMLIEGDTARVVRIQGYGEKNDQLELSVSKTFTLRHMRDTQQAMIIPNVENDPRWVWIGNDGWIKSYIAAPIRLNDEVIGYINLDSTIPKHFTNIHRQRLQAFADQCAIAIQNAQLYETNQRYTEDLEARVRERTLELTQINQELMHQMTKRIEAEEALSEERNILRTIINSLPDTIYVKNRQSEYILANRFPYTTKPEQPFLGKTDFDIIADRAKAQRLLDHEQELMKTGNVSIEENYTITPEGDEKWHIRTKIPFRDEYNEVIGLVGVNQDITQIKMAERQLRQLLSNAQCLLWYATVDYDGAQYHWDITVENEDNAKQFLPFDTSDKDYADAWIDSIPAEKQALRDTVASTHLKFGRPSYTIEYHCKTSDGETHWLNEDVQIQKINDNRWHLVGVSLDITDIKSAEIALRESHDQMEQRVIERTAELSRANKELQKEILIRQQAELAERQQRQLAEALKDSITAMNSTLDIEDVLDRLLDGIQHVIDHVASNIMLVNGNRLKTVRQRGYEYTVPDFALDRFKDIETVYKTRKPYIVTDTRIDLNWDPWKPARWIRSSLKLPIVYNDEVLGIIILDSSRPEHFTLTHAETLQAFANQASIALNNANLYQQAQREIVERKRAETSEREQRQFAETLRDTTITLNQHLNTNDLFDTVLTAMNKIITTHDTASIVLFDKDTMLGTVIKEQGFGKFGKPIEGMKINFDHSNTKQQLVQRHSPLLIKDTQQSDLWIDIEETRWIRSHIGIPIAIKDELLAQLNVDSQHPHAFTQQDVDRLVIFSHQVAIAVQNAQLVEQIQNYAQQLETRVAQRTQELELERSQLRAILDAMRDGVYYSQGHHPPRYINNALIDITGYEPELWLSGEIFDLINTEGNDRIQVWKEVEEHLREHQFWQIEAPLKRKDGTIFDASVTRTPVQGSDGTLDGIVTVVRDISLQKQLESQKSRFIANAAHELRTPITNIKTRLFLMRHAPDKFGEHMEIAESAIIWMQTLVDNLFEHSRFERGTIQLDIESVNLQEFLHMIVITQQAEAVREQIKIVADWQSSAIHLNADKSRLRQVITNLINNAIHYTPKNGTVTVRLRQTIQDNIPTVVISVADTGIGIDEAHLPYLFQPFYRATEDGRGAGLGLSISREIVEAHKGIITVESDVGKGTTFSINLPILTEQQLLEDA